MTSAFFVTWGHCPRSACHSSCCPPNPLDPVKAALGKGLPSSASGLTPYRDECLLLERGLVACEHPGLRRLVNSVECQAPSGRMSGYGGLRISPLDDFRFATHQRLKSVFEGEGFSPPENPAQRPCHVPGLQLLPPLS